MIINNVYTLFKDMGIFKKIFNYICSFIIFLLFFLYVILITTNGIDLGNIVSIYSNDTVLSIVAAVQSAAAIVTATFLWMS